jgi:hypothetical protein
LGLDLAKQIWITKMTEKEHLKLIKKYVALQAKDETLWKINPTNEGWVIASYQQEISFLQKELRILHAIIESKNSKDSIESIINSYEEILKTRDHISAKP